MAVVYGEERLAVLVGALQVEVHESVNNQSHVIAQYVRQCHNAAKTVANSIGKAGIPPEFADEFLDSLEKEVGGGYDHDNVSEFVHALLRVHRVDVVQIACDHYTLEKSRPRADQPGLPRDVRDQRRIAKFANQAMTLPGPPSFMPRRVFGGPVRVLYR